MLALAANDVWAAGNTLVEHWDGTRWSVVPIPNLGPGGSIDKLAAGARRGGETGTGVGGPVWGIMSPQGVLVATWDGKEWSAIRGPAVEAFTTRILGIAAATSPDEMWIAGAIRYVPWVARFRASACSGP